MPVTLRIDNATHCKFAVKLISLTYLTVQVSSPFRVVWQHVRAIRNSPGLAETDIEQ
jgi:hypothetical protein